MIKKAIKTLIPSAILQWRSQRLAKKTQIKFSDKSRAETFTEIYEKNIWGGNTGEFYSGDGSSEEYAIQYAAVIQKFIAEKGVKSLVDLGCGDFRVAAKFISGDINYIGIDVVESLIAFNVEHHAGERIGFRCMDIAEDDLPDGELCLIRQVLQHLSNAEISKILKKCEIYKYLIVTEHYPSPSSKILPNIDIPHGPGMRLFYDSAVFLDQPPFNLKNIYILLDVEAEEGSRLKTFLISNQKDL